MEPHFLDYAIRVGRLINLIESLDRMVWDIIGVRRYEDLEVVGYANAYTDEQLPTATAPLFRIKNDTGYLLPEKGTPEGMKGYILSETDYSLLLQRGEITPFNYRFVANPDYCLWIDDKRDPHYEPIEIANRNLDSLLVEYLKAGNLLFSQRNLQDARVAFARAYQLNTDCLEAFAGFEAIDIYSKLDTNDTPTWKLILKYVAINDSGKAQMIADDVDNRLRQLSESSEILP